MPELSSADHRAQPPSVVVPRDYNAAHDLIERNLRAGRGERTAFVDDTGRITYAQLARRVDRFASALGELGIRPEERVMLCMHDTIDWPVAFLGAIKAGVVPVAVNTLLKPADYEFMLRDSRARALFVSAPLAAAFDGLRERVPGLAHVVVVGGAQASTTASAATTAATTAGPEGPPAGACSLESVLAAGRDTFEPAATVADDMCFWLYSSGSTGAPKGTVHVHASLIRTAELYARPVLSLSEDDVVLSAAKLFFAYGLGNALTFPMAVGATAVLMAERPTPDAVFARLTAQRPTVFCGVPTLYAAMLASESFPAREALALRVCTSAGEALPADIGRRFTERTGVEILDGIGSTEMLHIYLSNRAGDVRYGTTGRPVPGYALRLVDDAGHDVPDGQTGDLLVSGPTSAALYWNNRERSRATFVGEWTRSGDKYTRDADGRYVYAGRSDDMLKVSGQYVSPFEVESAIASHPAVLEAAVVGHEDGDGLVKPKAWVVLKAGHAATPVLADALKTHVRDRLAPHKYPRWVQFVDELPKTATGKIQRFRLRG